MGKTDFAFTIVIMVTILGVMVIVFSDDGEGATVESVYNETNVYWNDFSGNQKFTHTKDDYIVTAFCNDDNDVMIAYRKPGGSWNYSEVCAFDFAGATAWKLGGIINTDNNSLVLMAGGYISSYYHVYYFTKFGGADWDEWDPLLFLYQASISFYIGDHAINDTGIILGMCRKSGSNWWTYRIFDFEAYTLSGTNPGLSWEAGAGSSTGFQIEANHTGKFWISWKDTDNIFYVMDFEKDLSQVAFHIDSKYQMQTFAFLDNGVCVAAGGYDYSTTDFPEYYHQEVPGDPFLAHRLDPISARTWNINYQIVVRIGSTVPVIVAYSETDEKLYTFAAEWDASEVDWQNSRYDTGISSTDEYFPHGASNSLWPSHETSGINWTRLEDGWAIIAENDENDPDEFMLINDGMSWTGNLEEPENQPPEFTNEIPINGSSGIQKQPWCHVTINDPEGDTFNVTWEENSTGSWVVRQQNLSVTNGTFWWQFTQATEYSVRYYWKVSANDSAANNTTIYHFDLLANPPPVGSLLFPLNGSSGITLTPTCRISVSDPNGDPMNISWLEDTTGPWVERHADTGVSNGGQIFSFTQFSSYLITYYWRINLTDGTSNVTYIYHFTTGANNPPSILNPIPINGSSGVSLSPVCYVTVGDHENMNISWFEWDGSIWTHQQTNTSVPSGTYGWLFSNASSNSTEYWWMANVTDGSINVSKMYYFTTLSPPGEEEEEEILDWTLNLTMVFMIIVVTVAGAGAVIMISRGMND